MGGKDLPVAPFGRFFANSAIISVLSTVGAVASSAIVGYGFARCRFKGKKLLFTCIDGFNDAAFQVMMIPQFIWLKARMGRYIFTINCTLLFWTRFLYLPDYAVYRGNTKRIR